MNELNLEYTFAGFETMAAATPDEDLQGMWNALLNDWKQTDSDTAWIGLALAQELDRRYRAALASSMRQAQMVIDLLTPDVPTSGSFELGGDL